MLNVLLCICALTTIADADRRYVIHPTNGEFVTTDEPCGDKTRDELFTRVIRYVPTLVIDDREDMTMIVKGDVHVADQMKNGDGWWNYIGQKETKHMVVHLSDGKPGQSDQKVISIFVRRVIDKMTCFEKWSGIVKEAPRGK